MRQLSFYLPLQYFGKLPDESFMCGPSCLKAYSRVVLFERRMRSCLLNKGENIGLAVSVIVLVIILCQLSSLKVLYYAMTTADRTVGVIAHRAK